MTEYVYTDPYGSRLRLDFSGTSKADVVIATEDTSEVDVPAADLPKIVAELYRAAGQEPPIILSRLNWGGTDRTSYSFNGVYVTRRSKAIGILGLTWDATTARGVARVLAEMADAADAEPDPAQLAALAGVVRELAAKDVLTTDDNGEAVARAILAAGYSRSES